MKKKLLLLLLAIGVTFAGCTSDNSDNNSDTDVTPGTNEVQENITPIELITEKDNLSIVENVKITDPEEALARLKEGNLRFINDESRMVNVTKERREQLTEGQSPYAVIVSCSDSRVTPNVIFNAGLGEIFDIRIAGNVVDSTAIGSIEYGLDHLHSPLLVIMGHESCGAVTAAYDELTKGVHPHGEVKAITDKINSAIQDADNLNEAIYENIDAVADQVEKNEVVKKLVAEGKVKVVKAYYSLSGRVEFIED